MEIATFTGHTITAVKWIIDKFYFNRDPAMAVNAMSKLEKEQSLQTALQTRACRSR